MGLLKVIAGAACVVLIACTGCTGTVEGTPVAARSDNGADGPILPGQLDDLLTPPKSYSVVPGFPLDEYDLKPALLIGAEPAECLGAVTYDGYPLFPANYNGNVARTQVDGSSVQHTLLEVSATYRSELDPSFLDGVRKKVTGCNRSVVVWADDGVRTTLKVSGLQDSSPNVVRWYTEQTAQQWFCEFALIQKANVVSQIVGCSPDRSVGVAELADKRLKKIDELLNSAA